jgi:hypothetical protein
VIGLKGCWGIVALKMAELKTPWVLKRESASFLLQEKHKAEYKYL